MAGIICYASRAKRWRAAHSMVQLNDPYTWWSAAVWALAASGTLAAAGSGFALTRRFARRAALRRRDARRAEYRTIVDRLPAGADLPASILTDPVFLTCLAEALDGASFEHRARLIAHCERFGYVRRFSSLTRSPWAWRRMEAARWLGRLGHRDGIPDVIRLTADRSLRVRSAAVSALGAVCDPSAFSALLNLLDAAALSGGRGRLPGGVLAQALVAQGPDVVWSVLPRLQSPSAAVRRIAAEVVAHVPHLYPRVGAALVSALEDRDEEVRARAAKALGRIADPGILVPLAKALSDPVWFVRLQAAKALGSLAHRRAVRPLVSALTDESWQVRAAAADALRRLGDPAVPALTESLFAGRDRYAKEQVVEELQRTPFLREQVEALDSQAPGAVFAAQRFLREVARYGATAVLLDALRTHPRTGVRRRLAMALGTVDVPRVIAVLHDLAEHDRDAGVREAARRALTGRSERPAGGEASREQAA